MRRRELLDPESGSPRSRSALRALRVNLLPFAPLRLDREELLRSLIC